MTKQWDTMFEDGDGAVEGIASMLVLAGQYSPEMMQTAFMAARLADACRRLIELEAIVKQHELALGQHGVQLCNHKADINLALGEPVRNPSSHTSFYHPAA